MMKMINMLWWLLVVVALVVLVGNNVANAEAYSMTTLVVELDYSNDIVTVMDFNENLWTFYGCEDWAIYDICSCTMDTNNTDIIYDDIITDVKYDGWFSGWLERLGI